jgi:hypothetical protein
LRVREAELPIVSEPECIRKVNAVTEKMFVLPASSFCAGGEFKNDACQGEEPLFMKYVIVDWQLVDCVCVVKATAGVRWCARSRTGTTSSPGSSPGGSDAGGLSCIF